MWNQHKTSIILAITFIVILSTFWLLPQLGFIVFIAILIDLLLRPLVRRLQTFRCMPRGLAAAISLIFFILLISSMLALLSTTLATSLQKFALDLPRLTEALRGALSSVSFLSTQLDELWQELASISITALRSSIDTLVSIFTKIFDTVIILFTSFYLLKDGKQIQLWISGLFPDKDRRRVFRLLTHILRSLHVYIYSQLIICFIMGFIVFCYFSYRDLPYPSVFAVISGISEFIPVIGPTIASAFGTALTATVSPWVAAQTMCFYIIITQLNHNIIYPTLIGRSLHLHPIAILIGILLGGCLLDAPGMFLAVPVMVIVRLVIIDVYHDGKQPQTRKIP